MKTNFVIDISPPVSGKILSLEIWGKIVSANQIIVFIKM